MRPTAGPSTSRSTTTGAHHHQGLARSVRARATSPAPGIPRRSGNRPTRSQRKPAWIRAKAPDSPEYPRHAQADARATASPPCARRRPVPTSASAGPQRHATVMILGDICTRACAFCNVATGKPRAGRTRRAEQARRGGRRAGHAPRRHHLGRPRRSRRRRRRPVRRAASSALRETTPETTIEILTPDFLRKPGAIETVARARPDVFNHNIETVPRLYREVRPGSRYFALAQSAVDRSSRSTRRSSPSPA